MFGILAIALFATQTSAALDVSEYFPLELGSTWRYLGVSSDVKMHFTSTVQEPVDFDGVIAIPIVTVFDVSTTEKNYYSVTARSVDVVSFSEYEKLPAPYTILQSPDVGEKWSVRAKTRVLGVFADLSLIGKVKRLRSRRFDGKSVDVLEVTLEGTIVEVGGILTEMKQVAVYGKGIGLMEMKQTSKTGSMTTTLKLTLEEYLPGKS
ncbi:MAG: hypothetical protein IH944_03530 [Armatimonadetes bacterium]|nr:hypothetical protein [Armatimonadota bacterium]